MVDEGAGPRRYRSLDGLRGVAAFSVVINHALLVVPALSVLNIERTNPSTFSLQWWFLRTPLRILMPGREAVLIFFVLSGFVLTLPLLHRVQTVRSTVAYYGRRLVRLYVPVWGAIAFSLVLAVWVPRRPDGGSSWMMTHVPPTVTALRHDILLLLGTSNLDSPLWSLTWEMWFSLLLPVLFVLATLVRIGRWWLIAIVALAMISAGSQFAAVAQVLPRPFLACGLLQYIPVFGIGVVLAMRRETLGVIARRVRSWWLLGVVALLLLLSPSMFISNSQHYRFGDAALSVTCLIGVAIVVFVAMEAPGLRAMLECPIVQWTGTRSFSIYLVHEPILVACALLVHAHGWFPWIGIAVLLIPVIMLLAEAFYRSVEHPAHRLAQRVGRTITGRRATKARAGQVDDRADGVVAR